MLFNNSQIQGLAKLLKFFICSVFPVSSKTKQKKMSFQQTEFYHSAVTTISVSQDVNSTNSQSAAWKRQETGLFRCLRQHSSGCVHGVCRVDIVLWEGTSRLCPEGWSSSVLLSVSQMPFDPHVEQVLPYWPPPSFHKVSVQWTSGFCSSEVSQGCSRPEHAELRNIIHSSWGTAPCSGLYSCEASSQWESGFYWNS